MSGQACCSPRTAAAIPRPCAARLPPREGLHVHRVSDLGEHHLHPLRKPPRTRTARAVVETELGRSRAQDAVQDIAGGCQSLPEVELRQFLRRTGLPLPDRQAVRCEEGRRRYLDNFWDLPPVVLEIDGALHLMAKTWWDDMWRDAELTLTGHRVFRIPALAVRLHQDRLERLLRRALVAADDPTRAAR